MRNVMNWIKNVTTIAISLSLSLIIAEMFVRSYHPQNLSGSWSTVDDLGLVINKSEGRSFQSYGDRKAEYAFEPFGIRSSFNPEHSTVSKVLVLGDSYTFGWLLNVDDTYIDLLAKANDHMVFLNAATGGWGASDYTAYAETYCERIKPEIILVVMNADDIGRMLWSNLYTYDPELKIVTRSEYKPTKKHRLKRLLNKFTLYDFLLENSHLLQFVRSVTFGHLIPEPKEDDTNPKETITTFGLWEVENIDYSNQFSTSLFQYLNNISAQCGSKLRIVYTGVQKKNNLGTYPTLEFIEYAKNIDFFNKLGIQFVDLSDTSYMVEYRRNLSKYTIENDNHPNEFGAKLLFEAINHSGILLTNK
jgi:hypothetical protein